MSSRSRVHRGCSIAVVLVGCFALLTACSSSSKPAAENTSSSTSTASGAPATPLGVTWMDGLAVPGTPAKYNKVGVIKVGPASAKNVLVLEPGTSAGSAYFVPLAQWIVSKASRLAGLVGRAPGEPARGPVGAERVQTGQGNGDAAVQLLPRLPQEPERQARTSRSSRTRRSRSPSSGG